MQSDFETPLCATPWFAVMRVACDDIAHLMREGFWWSTYNILPGQEQDSKTLDAVPAWKKRGLHYSREWVLADNLKSNHNNEDRSPSQYTHSPEPRWTAALVVLTPNLSLMQRFDLHMIKPEKVCCTMAWDPLNRKVYHYDWRYPSSAFNTIYGRRPMEGWWPWPKEPAEQTREEERQEEKCQCVTM